MFGWCRDVRLFQDRLQTSTNQRKQDNPSQRTAQHSSRPRAMISKYESPCQFFNTDYKRAGKKGITLHHNDIKMRRINRCISVGCNTRPELIDEGTQTHIHANQNNFHSISKIQRRDSLPRSPSLNSGHTQQNLPLKNKSSIPKSTDLNQETRATNCHVSESIRNFMQKSKDIINTESIHYRDCSKKDLSDKSYKNKNVTRLYEEWTGRTWSKVLQNEENVEEKWDILITQKKQMLDSSMKEFRSSNLDSNSERRLSNVSSDLFPQKSSDGYQKFKLTAEKRAILMDRDTIISQSNYQLQNSEKSLRVEQSQIFQPQIMSEFIPITKQHISLSEGYGLYLAIERKIRMIVSIKELPMHESMDEIFQQILIYKELEAAKSQPCGLLQLYQSYIDKDTYIFLKQPYEYLLRQLIQRTNKQNYGHLTNEVLNNVKQLILEMEKKDFYLKRFIKIDDLVFCGNKFKIHSANAFKIGNFHFCSVQSAISKLQNELKNENL